MILRIDRIAKRIIYIMIFVLYTSSFITELFEIKHFYTISTLVLMIPFIFFLYYFLSKNRIPRFFLMTVGFYSVFVLFTILSNFDQLLYAVARVLRMSSFVLTLEYMFAREGVEGSVDLLLTVFEVLIYGNLISMVIFPNGIHRIITNGIFETTVRNDDNWIRSASNRVTWLLGHQTTLLRYIIPTIVIALLYSLYKYKRLMCTRTVILMVACVIEIIVANSAANYIVLALFIIFIYILKAGYRIRTSWFFGLYTIFYMIIGSLSDNMVIFLSLSSLLGRSVKISTRIPIWANTITAILKHPLRGYGAIDESSEYIRRLLGLGNPHSQMLWVMFEAGILGFIAFFVYIKLSGERGRTKASIISSIIHAAFCSMLIAMLTDDYLFRNPYSLILLCLAYNTPLFDNDCVYMGTEKVVS